VKPKRAAAYVRVSSFDQNTESQETSLLEYIQRRGWILHKIYRDEGISGTKASRPALDELLRDCRRKAIDVVVVWKFDRFARSLTTLVSGLELCRALGIDFVSVTEAVDTSLPMGELMFQIIGAISQFERSLIAERVRSGLANARAKGKVLGRPPLRRLSGKETAALRRERVHDMLPLRTLATKFGVSVWTAHRLCGGQS
jgi:DNA invertase Pin-like site-specific DNA recombinase